MKRLLSKNMDSTFDSSQRLVLEIFLSHRHSPLFINATAETCYKLIHELAACLSLGEETIEISGSWNKGTIILQTDHDGLPLCT